MFVDKNRRLNPGVEYKLMDVPELGYFSTDNPPRGEFLVKSPYLFSGYYKIPSESFFQDGYFMTGDVVAIIPPDIVRVIDRKKNVVKLSQGMYIAPEELANCYNGCLYVEQMYIHANRFKDFVVAIVVPNSNFYLEYATRHQMTDTNFSLDTKKMISNQKEMKDFVS